MDFNNLTKLDKVILLLIKENRYYASFLANFKKVRNDKLDPATMAVGFSGVKNPKITLYYSQEFVDNTSIEKLCGVLIHETLHIILKHLLRFRYEIINLHTIANFATDMSINCLINKDLLPENCVFPSTFNLPDKKLADFYYTELLNEAKKSKGHKDSSNHSMWGKTIDEDGNVVDVDISESDVDYQVRKAAIKAYRNNNNSFGNVGSDVASYLDDLCFKSTYNWKRELNIFINSVLNPKKRSSYKRANRRFVNQSYVIAGYKSKRIPRLLVVRDTSGSCFDGKIQQDFLAEIIEIGKNCDIEVLDCDTQIKKSFKPKKLEDFKEYKGGGGTSFIPAFEYAAEKKYEGLIYLTDTEGSFPNRGDIGMLASKTIWVTFNQKSVDIPFGKHVNIEG